MRTQLDVAQHGNYMCTFQKKRISLSLVFLLKSQATMKQKTFGNDWFYRHIPSESVELWKRVEHLLFPMRPSSPQSYSISSYFLSSSCSRTHWCSFADQLSSKGLYVMYVFLQYDSSDFLLLVDNLLYTNLCTKADSSCQFQYSNYRMHWCHLICIVFSLWQSWYW